MRISGTEPSSVILSQTCSIKNKVIANVKVDNRQTDKQTDRTKTIYPRSFDSGA